LSVTLGYCLAVFLLGTGCGPDPRGQCLYGKRCQGTGGIAAGAALPECLAQHDSHLCGWARWVASRRLCS